MVSSSDGRTKRILVGVDGSPSSVSALRWAIREAEILGGAVEAISVWQYPLAAGEYGWEPDTADQLKRMRAAAGRALAQAIEDARPPGSDIEVERRTIEGYAPKVLVGESARADLLVLGSRGHGTFADVLLGSVSQSCAHHARCPVVIMRGGRLDA